MRRPSPLPPRLLGAALTAAALALLAGCGVEQPFIFHDPLLARSSIKMPDMIRKTGKFDVCFGDGQEAAADRLASETCAGYKLRALKFRVQHYQCSMTEPHQATYFCVDPAMRMADGRYVNPLNGQQVKLWRAQQQRLKAAERRHGIDVAPPPAPKAPPRPDAQELGAPPPPDIPAVVPPVK